MSKHMSLFNGLCLVAFQFVDRCMKLAVANQLLAMLHTHQIFKNDEAKLLATEISIASWSANVLMT